jgi:glyoxylase-like metal-dependent hydrolase (beta-lactamase superfamily II)
MPSLFPGISYADLEFLQQARVIATAWMVGPPGVTIVDPGPSSTLPMLRRHLASAGLEIGDIASLFLTHIHLDHAGSTGTLVRENPRIRVHVHEIGAPHMMDPSRLVSSAARLYGDAMMDQLWGPIEPVPESAIVRLRGGEQLTAGGREWEVAYTPGHAAHHVSFFNRESGLAFVGDTAGVQVVPGGFVLPPTPPPDIDIQRWLTSLATIEAWRPGTLFLTHFGPSDRPDPHLAELREHLQFCEQTARDALASGGDEPAMESQFVTRVRREMLRRLTPPELDGYELAGRFDLNWRGLARYLRKVATERR